MSIVQGFVTRSDFINNVKDVVSPIFELSPDGKTYGRNIGDYKITPFPQSTLYTFITVDDQGEDIVLNALQVSEAIELSNALLQYVSNHNPPFDRPDLIATITASFHNRIKDFNIGEFVNNASKMVPEWYSWESLDIPGFHYKIWLKDEAFREQYTGFEIAVTAPIDHLDAFFGNYGQMVNVLKDVTFPVMQDRIQMVRGEFAPTFTRGYNFDYVNPNNPNQKTPAPWAALVYGKNGDNIDTIKDEIVEYVLANSTHPREDWAVIFPELFKRTEFVFFPRWDKIAIPNLTVLAALYSNMQDPMENLRFIERVLPDVDQNFIGDNTTIIPFEYRCISLTCLNGANNDPTKAKINELYPDYLPVQTTSPDFDRMSVKTKNWVTTMVKLIREAEVATEFSSVVNPMRRVHRGGITYLSMYYDNINFLVAVRNNGIYQ